jgi:exodeoxyribonuclease-3
MRIVSWNVNGIRAAIRKGIDRYFEEIDADIWMFQETRCLEEQLPKDWALPNGYSWILHPAEKKGYSGVATMAKGEFEEVRRGKGGIIDTNDSEGRILITRHGNLTLVNTYLPSGSAREERQRYKEQWMKEWRDFVSTMLTLDEPVIPTPVDFCHKRGNGLLNYLGMGGMIYSANMLERRRKSTLGGPIEVKRVSKIGVGALIISLAIKRHYQCSVHVKL